MGLFDFLLDVTNYDTRKVARMEPKDNGGIGVSTAYTSDQGYETALLGKQVHPVERYTSKELALAGHARWVEYARSMKSGDSFTELGNFGMPNFESKIETFFEEKPVVRK
jgi:hypothetical protein